MAAGKLLAHEPNRPFEEMCRNAGHGLCAPGRVGRARTGTPTARGLHVDRIRIVGPAIRGSTAPGASSRRTRGRSSCPPLGRAAGPRLAPSTARQLNPPVRCLHRADPVDVGLVGGAWGNRPDQPDHELGLVPADHHDAVGLVIDAVSLLPACRWFPDEARHPLNPRDRTRGTASRPDRRREGVRVGADTHAALGDVDAG